MNVFQSVTLKTLLKNKTRTAVTIIGIALSAAMLCAVTSSITSLMDFGQQNMKYSCGDWYGNAIGVQQQDVRLIADDTESSVVAQQLGYARLDGCINESKPYLFVLGADEGFCERMPVHLTEGRLPENSSELLLPDHLSSNGGIVYSVGDRITLDLGSRTQGENKLGQFSELQTTDDGRLAETFSVRESREYTVSGFYERPDFENRGAPGYTAVTVMDDKPFDGCLFDVYYKTAKPNEVYSFVTSHSYFGNTNSNLLMFMGVSSHEAFGRVLYGLAAIIIALIMCGAVSLIYNAFSISVSERTKQFGLLSSVGATSRQIRSSVTFEALTLSVLGIPLGIFAGLAGMWVTFYFLGEKFMSLSKEFNVPMRLKATPLAIVITVVIALITVLISASVPSRRAMKVTAIEAIRQTRDVSAAKKVKTSRLAFKIFGLPGMLANKYFKRSRKKYRATILSLFMSVVLFVTASSFTGYLTSSVSGAFNVDKYDVSLYLNGDDLQGLDRQELLDKFKTDEYVTSASMSCYAYDLIKFDSKYSFNGKKDEASALICFVDNESYENYAASLGIKAKDVDGVPPAIAVEGYANFNRNSGRIETERIFASDRNEFTIRVPKAVEGYSFSEYRYEDENSEERIFVYRSDADPDRTLEMSESEALIDKALSTVRLVTDSPDFMVRASSLTLIYPETAKAAIYGESYGNFVADANYWTLLSSDHSNTYTNISRMLANMKLQTQGLNDNRQDSEQNSNIVTIINVFSYGFIVLISLIAVANVFNTVSTNIGLRRRDFAMLKSVGMTRGGMNGMMNYECLLYGSRSLFWGLLISLLTTTMIYFVINDGFETQFRVPWIAMLVAALSVFIVVFATMMYSMRKIKRDNPIDALKNENV